MKSSSKFCLLLLLVPVLGLGGCASKPVIHLNPPVALAPPPPAPRRVARAAPAATFRAVRPVAADAGACASPALQGLTPPRKAELFRQFAEQAGEPPADAPVPASLPPCPPGSR